MIEFTQEMKEALDNSFGEQMFVIVGTAGADGMPDVAFKGSVMSWGSDHIAFWERALGTTYRNLLANPQVCFLYRNPAKRLGWKFFGVAEVHTAEADSEVRRQVMARTVQFELDRDPERKGAAVVVRIDRIVQGPQVLQEREAP